MVYRGLIIFFIRFEKEYGYLRPIVENVMDKYLDCGNPKNGFARLKCKDCCQAVQQELAAEDFADYF